MVYVTIEFAELKKMQLTLSRVPTPKQLTLSGTLTSKDIIDFHNLFIAASLANWQHFMRKSGHVVPRLSKVLTIS